MLTKDGEGGAEVYSAATKRDQAKIVWDEAKRMIKKSPALAKRTRCLVGGIYYDKTESYMKALASDSNSLDGLNTHFRNWRRNTRLEGQESTRRNIRFNVRQRTADAIRKLNYGHSKRVSI